MIGVLMESSVRAALIAAVVWGVDGGLRLTSARARHRAWCGVLAAMLLLPALVAWGPNATLRVLPAGDPLPVSETLMQALPPAPAAGVPVIPVQQVAAVEPAARQLPGLPDLALLAYALIAGFFLVRLAMGTAKAAALRRRATREEGFHSSSECACPVTVGWMRPVVILPSAWRQWPEDELRAVLAHEREHARRRDPLAQWLAALNRSVFWFHPLAWWLERRLALLAEEACDSAAVANGHDPREYSEYLLNQARAIQMAGARLPLGGSTMGRGPLAKRIERLMEGRHGIEPGRRRAAVATALSVLAIVAFSACELVRVEKAAPGQPTMAEQSRRATASQRQGQQRNRALRERASSLTPAQVEQLSAQLKEKPGDADTYWTLVYYYEQKWDPKGRSALWLWFIEHHPDGPRSPGTINPQHDREGYARGRSLWLAHLKRPGATAAVYERAAWFLEAGDGPLALAALEAGQKAYPDDQRWTRAISQHYARTVLASGGTGAEQDARSRHVKDVRERLDGSNDAKVLAQTAYWLIILTPPQRDVGARQAAEKLARGYVERALSVEPGSTAAATVKGLLDQIDMQRRAAHLASLPKSELARMTDEDRFAVIYSQLRMKWIRNPAEAEVDARELLALAARNPKAAHSGAAVFEANLILGKAALRRGEKKAAARHLMAAAETTGSESIRRGDIEMNLARALVDWGERSVVAEFLEKMAPKTVRSEDLRRWAAEIRKGVNPDLRPTMSYMGCTQGPC